VVAMASGDEVPSSKDAATVCKTALGTDT